MYVDCLTLPITLIMTDYFDSTIYYSSYDRNIEGFSSFLILTLERPRKKKNRLYD